MAKEIKRQLERVHKKVQKEISDFASRGSPFSAGLASEGYNGGYLDAISDVMLALNGVTPNYHKNWWSEEDSEQNN